MTDPDFASRQLRVIRSLMERATIYRSLSAPTALTGGLLSLGGFATAYYAKHYRHHSLTPQEFLTVWLVILVLTSLTNAWFLWRESQRRGTAFFSAGMKCAMFSLAPAFLCAGVLTLCIYPAPIFLAPVWVMLYGLGLLATQHFAPRSIVVLGLMFSLTGSLAFIFLKYYPPGFDQMYSTLGASWLMAATFGGFHLAYAAAVWALGGEHDAAPEVTPNESGNV